MHSMYTQTDGGTEKNCFNLDCGGFHLHESQYVLGDSWADSDSQVGGRRFYVTLGIHRVSFFLHSSPNATTN
jgi:hypothetical protein